MNNVSAVSSLSGVSRPGPQRELRIFADGREIAQGCRIRLSLLEHMSLLPQLYSLEIENLSESSQAQVASASSIEVQSGNSVLASGSVISVCPRNESGRKILSVSFSPGFGLWQSVVALSVTDGLSVSDTMKAVLASSGSGVPLAAFLAKDKNMTRPQAFFGRVCDALRILADTVSAKACLTAAGLCVVDPSLQAPTVYIPESFLAEDPVFLPDRYILKTEIAGWPLGTCLQFTWQGRTYQGLLSARMLNLDNVEGPWQSQLEVTVTG